MHCTACMEESRLAFPIDSGLNLKQSEMDTEGEKFKDIAHCKVIPAPIKFSFTTLTLTEV